MARRIQVEIVGDSRSVERAFKRANRAGDTFGGRMKGIAKAGALAGAALAAGAVAVGVSAVKAAASFEKTMSRVQGLAGQSQKQVKEWGDQLIALGPQLGKSPQELAEALYFVASSGAPAAQAISVVTAAAKASAAGLGETEVVADAVTSVMNAYSGSAMSAARATDVLVAIVREGKGEADAFAGTIGSVSAFASRLKVPFEEVGAALAAMTQLGTDPRTAATQLTAFFSSMLKQTDKAKKAARSVGLDFDVMLNTLQEKGLLATLKMIKKGFAGNTKEMANAFPNIRALRALLGLVGEDGGKVAAIFQRMAKSGGSLGVAFGAAEETASHNIDVFNASIKALQIAFGQGLLPVVSEAAQALGAKFADPKFVERVRMLGKLIGTGLRSAFVLISTWFDEHWNQIKEGFRIGAGLAGGLAKAVQGIARAFQFLLKLGLPVFKVMIAQIKLLLALISGLARAFSHLPFIGGKFAGVAEAIDKVREGVRVFESGLETAANVNLAGGGGRRRRRGGRGTERLRGLPRQHGGSVMPGVAYRVGERGPETFVPAMAGSVLANGASGVYIAGDVHLHNVQNARQLLDELQRLGRRSTAQRRGRHGGHNLALT